MSEVEELRAEVARLQDIIKRAYDFNEPQTKDGVTREGYLSPDEWALDQIGVILKEGVSHPESDTDTH